MMSRRRLVALVSAVLMLTIGATAIGAFVIATQSERGRELIRRFAQAQLERSMQGSVHLGTLSGSFLTDLRIDSLRIADRNDSLFLATGPLRVTYDPRDLADGRIILRTVEVERPYIVARLELDGTWTHRRIWPRSATRRAIRRQSGFGAVLVLEHTRVHDGEFALLMPWAPDTAPDERITRARRWLDIQLDVPRARLAYPDSVGMHLSIARLDVIETDPPFALREVRGDVRLGRDTLAVDFPHLALPGSVARASGQVHRGRGEPARYDFRIISDSLALADVAWINPAIPTEGHGRMVLDVRNPGPDAGVAHYVITQMDIRTHRSRLAGRMTWGVDGRDVDLRDVDLEMLPLDHALLERFNQGPLGVPLRGQITGRLRARGGPLSDFVVDDATATFRDANVPGATSRLRAAGVIDISDPALPVFRGLRLDIASFDLRTAHALDEAFPRLNGTLHGTARLDSAWGDVRVVDADITLRDGDAPESRLSGGARLSWLDGPLRWELDAAALPISFTALARSFPALPLRGEFTGPLSSAGTGGDLTLVADLLGDAGRIESDLRIDPEAPRLRVTGRATLTNVDPRRLLDDSRAPTGELTARMSLDAQGDALADLSGAAHIHIDRSLLEGVRIFTGTLQLGFGDGVARLDTLYLESSAVDLAGRGALGLRADVHETVTLRARMDSLGGLRPWLGRPLGDSLAGSALAEVAVAGWLRDFEVRTTAEATGLLFAGSTAGLLRADLALRGLPSASAGTASAGTASLRGDSLRLAGLALRDAEVDASRDTTGLTDVALVARGPAGTQLRASGALEQRADSTRVRVDSIDLLTSLQRWRLAAPATLAAAEGGFRVDAFALRGAGDAAITVAGVYPADEPLDLRLTGRDVAVADIAELLQLEGSQQGRFALDGHLTGTRAAPRLAVDGELRGGLVRGVRLDSLRTRARAQADRLDLRLELGSRARPSAVATADLPLVLGLTGQGIGMRDDGSVRGRVTAEALGLEVFESLTRGTSGARGTMTVALDVGGTWGRPLVDGTVNVRNGFLAPTALGNVRWRNVQADIAFHGDSVAVRTLAANSGSGNSGRASLTGWASVARRDDPRLDFRFSSREFNVFSQPGIAEVDVSGELFLGGALSASTLRGALTADRAIIGIPELASKDVIALEGPDGFGVVDTLLLADPRAVATAPPELVENLTIANVPLRMGRDVWIRSSEANINLGGEVNITRGRATRGPSAGQLQLAVDGPLRTVRGTYRLNLGPVQRTFEVEQGEIRFFGEPELNPSLDITALHTVRQYSEQGVRPDVRVRVHLGGTLQQPTAELSTPDSVRVTNADLISYLVTGGPSFDIGGRDGDISATAARVLLGSIGSVLGGKVAGGLCDDAQLSTAGLEGYGGRVRQVGGGILSGTRFNCAKQVGERAFVRLDAGLCQVGQLMTQSGSDPLSFTDALGVKLDYLLGSGFSASVGVEPPTSAVLCAVNANASARGFVPTPRQVGLDIFRVWRF